MDAQEDGPEAGDARQHSKNKTVNRPRQRHMICHAISWVPPWCRWEVDNPPPFTMWLNILYALAGGFTSANLSYSYPILNVIDKNFHTSQAGVASIPTLAQAGVATGLLFILPLADFFPRRRFILTLVACSAAFW
jgi:hypothetical protein